MEIKNDQHSQIHSFGLAYLEFKENHKASPQSIEDLHFREPAFPKLARDIRSGEFVVIWNARLCPFGGGQVERGREIDDAELDRGNRQ